MLQYIQLIQANSFDWCDYLKNWSPLTLLRRGLFEIRERYFFKGQTIVDENIEVLSRGIMLFSSHCRKPFPLRTSHCCCLCKESCFLSTLMRRDQFAQKIMIDPSSFRPAIVVLRRLPTIILMSSHLHPSRRNPAVMNNCNAFEFSLGTSNKKYRTRAE